MHEVRSRVRHQADDRVAESRRFHRSGNVLFDFSESVRLLDVENLAVTDQLLRKRVCDSVLEFEQDFEEFFS